MRIPHRGRKTKKGVVIDIVITITRCDVKIPRFYAKIEDNFDNYFLKTKANSKCFVVLKCTCKGLQKRNSELEG